MPGEGPDDEDRGGHPAEALLAQARSEIQTARAQGEPYLAAVGHVRAGQALLILSRPDEALADFDGAQSYVDLLRADGDHEFQRSLRIMSAGLPPPDARHGDLGSLEAWIGVGRSAALSAMGRWADARVAVDRTRPLVKGWGRRDARKALDLVAAEVARADGGAREALSALDRVIADRSTSEADRRQARYERAAHLVDDGRPEEGMREALLLLRDTDDDPALAARTRQVLGAALAALGRDADATLTLREAFDGFVALDDRPAVLAAAPGLAWRLADSGDPGGAAHVCSRALEFTAGDPATEAGLRIALATTLDGDGRREESVEEFSRAAAAAQRAGDIVRVSDARHGEAIVRSRSGDPGEAVDALSLLDAAAAGYAEGGLPERAASCQHEAAALLGRLGSFDAAAARYASAREAYLAIPDVLRSGDPDALADCDYNLAVLTAMQSTPSPAPPDAFLSGGHHMRHSRESR